MLAFSSRSSRPLQSSDLLCSKYTLFIFDYEISLSHFLVDTTHFSFFRFARSVNQYHNTSLSFIMDITLIRQSEGGNITGAVFYPYNPSQPPAYAFMALFAIATLAHIIYMFPLRAWYFITFILGGICKCLLDSI